MRSVRVIPGPGGRVSALGYEVVVTGEFVEIIEEDLDSYVNVRMTDGTSYEWTYRDPSGELEVGDLVEVPFGYDNRPRIASVVSLGKGSRRAERARAQIYDGPRRIKDVTATFARVELS